MYAAISIEPGEQQLLGPYASPEHAARALRGEAGPNGAPGTKAAKGQAQTGTYVIFQLVGATTIDLDEPGSEATEGALQGGI